MKIIPCKWVLTLKTDEHGVVNRFKARLVAGGHRQIAGIDFSETYAPVSRLTTLRMLLSVAAFRGWKVKHIDIKTAFLHGAIDVDVFMTQPPGFVDGRNQVIKLSKCLYGLRQAPRAWWMKLAACLTALGLIACSADSSLWVGKDTPAPVFLATVVDDMIITSPDEAYTDTLIAGILQTFPGTRMGTVTHYNGMRLVWMHEGRQCMLLQQAHIMALADTYRHLADLTIKRILPMRASLKLCKTGTSDIPQSDPLDTSVCPFRALLGSLNFIATGTRPDICHTLNQLARYANAPTEAHWNVALDLLRYLITTQWWGIVLGAGGLVDHTYVKYYKTPVSTTLDAVAYADANHGTGMDDRRSVSGTLIQVLGGPVSWSSHVQPTQAISTVDSEIHAMSAASREALWVAKLNKDFGLNWRPFVVRGDSQGGIAAIKNYAYTKHTKHIGIHQDFMRDRYRTGDLDFEYVPGTDNTADIFTKPLPLPAFAKHRAALGMMELHVHLR